MNPHFTTDVALSEDRRELVFSGPKTGVLRLRYARTDDAIALYDLLQVARQRCWSAYSNERVRGRTKSEGPGKDTQEILAEIVTLTELAIETAETIS